MKLAVTRTAQPRRLGQSQQSVKRPFDILRIGDFVAHTWRGDRHVSHSVREPLVSCANELTPQVEPHRRTRSRVTCSDAAPTSWPLRLPNQSACSSRESRFFKRKLGFLLHEFGQSVWIENPHFGVLAAGWRITERKGLRWLSSWLGSRPSGDLDPKLSPKSSPRSWPNWG